MRQSSWASFCLHPRKEISDGRVPAVHQAAQRLWRTTCLSMSTVSRHAQNQCSMLQIYSCSNLSLLSPEIPGENAGELYTQGLQRTSLIEVVAGEVAGYVATSILTR